MGMMPPDIRPAVPVLRNLLGLAVRRGQAQISFDDLRSMCLSAIQSVRRGDDPAPARDPQPSASESASVLAALLIHRYVQRNHPWTPTKDRRDRLYGMSHLVDMLDDSDA